MIKKEIENAINKQIAREMFSSNLYLSMSAYYATQNLNGFAAWMRIQAEEEMMHALKFFDYVLNRGGKVQLEALEAPENNWDSPLHAFEEAFVHEQKVTAWINGLADLAFDMKDHATMSLLNWFIDEQVEEEANTSQIVDRMKMVADSRSGLFMLDTELKSRPRPASLDANAGA